MILSFGTPLALAPGKVSEMTRNLLGGIFCWLFKRHADNRVLTLLGLVIVESAAGSLQNRMARADPEDIVVIDEDS